MLGRTVLAAVVIVSALVVLGWHAGLTVLLLAGSCAGSRYTLGVGAEA